MVPKLGAATTAARDRAGSGEPPVVERLDFVPIQRTGGRRQHVHHVHAEQLVDERPWRRRRRRRSGTSAATRRGTLVLKLERRHRRRGQAQAVRVRRPVGRVANERRCRKRPSPPAAVRATQVQEKAQENGRTAKGENGRQTPVGSQVIEKPTVYHRVSPGRISK